MQLGPTVQHGHGHPVQTWPGSTNGNGGSPLAPPSPMTGISFAVAAAGQQGVLKWPVSVTLFFPQPDQCASGHQAPPPPCV
jgi:hypothetical protein